MLPYAFIGAMQHQFRLHARITPLRPDQYYRMAPRPLFSIRLTARAFATLALATAYVATSIPVNTPALAQQPPEATPAQPAAPLPDAQATLAGPFTQGLAISGIVRSGRSLVRLDSFSHLLATDPSKATPQEGDTLPKPDGTLATWQSVNAGENNAFASDVGQGGYLFCTRENTTSQPRVMVLEAKGHGVAIVNGEPRMGDPYGYGYMSLPVLLQPGINTFVFAPAGRGGFSASLREPRGLVEIETGDITAPDIVRGNEALPVPLGLSLRNCYTEPLTVRLGTLTVAMHADGDFRYDKEVVLPPLSLTKHSLTTNVPFTIVDDTAQVYVSAQYVPLPRTIHTPKREATHHQITLRRRAAHETRTITFVDPLDHSTQYYAVVPPAPSRAGAASGGPIIAAKPGIVLSLHGASVEAISQAQSYAPKPNLWIVCPTNRRPFGFDWEDWGRSDALAVLHHAKQSLDYDPSRVYLTGHSMGGHGTWQLGSLFPDLFAAIAPSAGWISFDTYPQAAPPRTHPMSLASQRAANTSDTLALKDNLANLGVFILHGDADDNVPVSLANTMAATLKEFHTDYRMHIEVSANHWWDSGEFASFAGAACTDFPPLFDFFDHRRKPTNATATRVRFTTVNPFVSRQCYWATIHSQLLPLDASTLDLSLDRAGRVLMGTTTNVRELEIDSSAFTSDDAGKPLPISLKVDGQELQLSLTEPVLRKVGDVWQTFASALHHPRPASFKDGFSLAGFVLVYPTMGTPQENAAGYAKARFDAEQWLYRGNGSVQLVEDLSPTKSTTSDVMISAVLYGNADTNSVWRRYQQLFTHKVTRGRITRGDQTWEGNDLALLALERLFTQSNRPSHFALVGTTGTAGDSLAARIPYFVSGAGIAPITLLKPDMFTKGWDGVLLAEQLPQD